MTAAVTVVGSGASGVHFALSLLRKGRRVIMLDVGRRGPSPPAPELSFDGLKENLEDPSSYFLGPGNESVLFPGADREYYGIPPSKDFVFDASPDFSYSARGFEPLFSFARGGLAEAWTAGCYPLNSDETSEYPFPHSDLADAYNEVARRIGITGEDDDLAQFMPIHDHMLPPLKLDAHSEKILCAYSRKRVRFNRDLGVYIGRTRVATLSRDMGERKACDYLGRCLWGCPRESLYTPSLTLKECQAYPGFEYLPGLEVEYFTVGSGRRVDSVVARPIGAGAQRKFPVDRLVLAAGTLLSSAIVLRSILRETGERVRLSGLMDNRQVLVPFLNLGMIGKRFEAQSYQYHLLGMGVATSDPRKYVHGQITTLKTALLHPIVQQLPFDLRTSMFLTRAVHAGLGLINVNFPDTRRGENFVTLASDGGAGHDQLSVRYTPQAGESLQMRNTIRTVRKALRGLGCVVPPGMTHVRPMGASVHYAGTLPMTREAAPLTTTPHCQSRDFENLFLVDGSTLPSLPAKNITLTLMANAVRVAEVAF